MCSSDLFPSHDRGAIGYVMKYMRKQPYVPKGMNPIFFLSSRKDGGLGAKYAKQYIDFYRKNPQCLDISACHYFVSVVYFNSSACQCKYSVFNY